MSTRAIIALPLKSGGYETAWCWNDGGPNHLGRQLQKYFKDEQSVRQLIKEHSFSSMWGPKQINGVMSDGSTAVVLSNLRYLLKHPHNGDVVAGEGENGFFKDIPSMLGEDLNYIYVFENGKWKTYK